MMDVDLGRDATIRYAIRWPDGTYTRSADRYSIRKGDLSQAQLFKRLGDLTCHARSVRRYEGSHADIVEVHVITRVVECMTLAEKLATTAVARAKADKGATIARAKRLLADADAALQRAERMD